MPRPRVGFQRPPVNIAGDAAASLSFSMQHGASVYAAGAGGYGRKMLAAKPLIIRQEVVVRGPTGHPNSQANRRALTPSGRTYLKKGYEEPKLAAEQE